MKRPDGTALRALWRLLATALHPERLRQLVTRNLGLKLLSLVIAFGLWSFVNFGERDTEESLKAPLELRNIPANLMITNPRVDFIDLRVMGPRTLLGRIDRNRLSIALDLNGVRPGPAVFRVGAESLNLPRGVKVMRINPSQVTLELARVGSKSVPVRVQLVGKPSPDLQVVSTDVSPDTVQVTGPAPDVNGIDAVNTEPLDVSTAAPGTLERQLPLEPLGEYVSLNANRVAVMVRVQEVEVSREFERVAIEVRNGAADLRVTPDTVRVTVRGPKRLVGALQLTQGSVYIEARDGQDSGPRDVEPTVDLPAGVLLVSLDPATVELSLPPPEPPAPEGP